MFHNNIALVTGGRSGIGYAIAKMLLQQGATVVIASRKEAPLQAAAAELSAFGTVDYHVCDIRKTDQIAQLADAIAARHGRLDILVNNAGGQFPMQAEYISENGWNAVINNNLNGTFYMTQAMANRFFIPQQSGSIVNIIVDVYRGVPGMAHTGAARAGVQNLSMSLAIEWVKHGIRINCVAPGIIQSSGLDQYPPELMNGIEKAIPMQRLGHVDDIAYATCFLASPMASYITGETLYVDGGRRLSGELFKFY
jgi:citronellol/citronellal dehydrogenase